MRVAVSVAVMLVIVVLDEDGVAGAVLPVGAVGAVPVAAGLGVVAVDADVHDGRVRLAAGAALPPLAGQVDEALHHEEDDQRGERRQALPHQRALEGLQLGLRQRQAGEVGVRQQVQHGVAGQRADGQRHQELDEVLVEDLLHDGDDQHAEDAAQRDDQHGAGRLQPDVGVAHAAPAPALLRPVGVASGLLVIARVALAVVVALLVSVVVVVVVVVPGRVHHVAGDAVLAVVVKVHVAHVRRRRVAVGVVVVVVRVRAVVAVVLVVAGLVGVVGVVVVVEVHVLQGLSRRGLRPMRGGEEAAGQEAQQQHRRGGLHCVTSSAQMSRFRKRISQTGDAKEEKNGRSIVRLHKCAIDTSDEGAVYSLDRCLALSQTERLLWLDGKPLAVQRRRLLASRPGGQ